MSAKTGDQSVIAITSESIDSEKKVSVNGANDSLKDFNSMDIKLSPSPTDEYMGVQESGASLFSSIVNVMNTIIGAGVLSIPSTVGTSGLVGSFLILAISLYLSLEGAKMLSSTAVYTKAYSYGGVGSKLGNPAVGVVGDIAMILFDFGISVAYFIILFDQAADLVVAWGHVSTDSVSTWKPWLSAALAFFIGFPVLCIPTIDALRFTSTASIICIGLFVVISAVKGIGQVAQGGLAYKWFPDSFSGLVSSISVFFTSMCCPVNIPKMTAELKFPSSSKFASKVAKMNRINTVAFLSCGSIYFIVGAFGYLAYGDAIEANLLTNFSNENAGYLYIVKFAYAFVVLFSYPTLAFAGLVTLDERCFKQSRPTWRRCVEAFIWTCLSLFVALVFPILDKVFGVTGSLCGILLNFAIPAFYYVLMAKKERAKEMSSRFPLFKVSKTYYAFSWFLFYIGIVAAVVFTAIQLKDVIQSFQEGSANAFASAPSVVPSIATSVMRMVTSLVN